jgi:hypothetical protein
MKIPSSAFVTGGVVLVVLILFGIGVRDCYSEAPPVGAPLVREGAFAIRLAEGLGVGHPASEAEAESMLGAAGVAPRNGWIADYPVTPDIIGELRDSVSYATQAKTLSMDSGTALKVLENVQATENLSVLPGAENAPAAETQMPAADYPDQTVINNYYYDQGPPILTYYAPPVDYSYLYSWVPYPFWWSGFWFGGFFILNDFHRHFREDGHFHTVSNHFNDTRAHRVFRVDPVNRSRGRTFAGIGAPRSSKFISTGTKASGSRIFNPGPGRTNVTPSPTPATGTYRKTNPFHEQKVYRRAPYSGGRTLSPPIQGGSRGFSAPGAPSGRGDGIRRGGGGGAGRDMRR